MDRETFEQLLSQWLDHPHDDELRAAVEAAAAESPELDQLKKEWARLDQLLRCDRAGIDRVDWPRFRQRISAELIPDEIGLDESVRDATAIEQRVDWPRLRQRISQAVDRADDRTRVIRFPLRRVAAGLLLVGAAAVLVLIFAPPLKSSKTNVGIARVRVNLPATAMPPRNHEAGFARVMVSPSPEVQETGDEAQSSRSGRAQPQLAEVFLMVEPVRVAARSRGGLTPFGFN
ncbi:MAG: hypothetical protein KKI02_11750 [Planctomycetes bacterium]|nr:hypothetical protein [Planctomycetota bacterium]